MNRQQTRQLRKHPFVRFIRGVIRLLRVLFRPSKNSAREIELQRLRVIKAQEQELAERYITVSNLFDRVEWQFIAPLEIEVPQSKAGTRQHDVSLN